MNARWMLLAMAIATACGQGEQATAGPVPARPPPVSPVEVTAPTPATTPAQPDELAQLRARVAQLEADLASCRNPQPGAQPGAQPVAQPTAQGTQATPLPAGVDVPPTTPTEATPTPAQGEQRAANDPARTTTTTTRTTPRRREDGTLIDQILGPEPNEGRRRQDDDRTIQLPNPANILLGGNE